MATATTETVKKMVEKEVQEKVYTLTLNEEEAKTLASLTGWVAGDRTTTYRKYTQPVYDALRGLSVSGSSSGSRFSRTDVTAARINN